jgi:hypothetical protein
MRMHFPKVDGEAYHFAANRAEWWPLDQSSLLCLVQVLPIPRRFEGNDRYRREVDIA